jgi:hypothetical protein
MLEYWNVGMAPFGQINACGGDNGRYLFEKFPYARTCEDVFNLLPVNISRIDLTN